MRELNTELKPVPGIKLAAVSAGIKKPGRLDLVLFEICTGATSAGVFTLNAFCAAPVTLARKHLAESAPSYFLINTGNANAGTGAQGMQAALACCSALATEAKVNARQILPFSTGVIGQALPVEKIVKAIPLALSNLSNDAWLDAALGIMTTDTLPKSCSEQIILNGKTITITGIAKGAGMIKPNMATMLGFVFTDALVEKGKLQKLLQRLADKSFNRITVDGDTSTNDSCMLVATGRSGVDIATLDDNASQQFEQALLKVFMNLAKGLIKDAEGASKFVTVRIEGGKSSSECLQVAYAIAESPLVKTALFASDPNWGRILAAAGRSGVSDLDVNALEIYLNDVCIVRDGGVCHSYTEAQGQHVMDQPEITILLKLGRGNVTEEVWTCDLSHDYVTINAEYRT